MILLSSSSRWPPCWTTRSVPCNSILGVPMRFNLTPFLLEDGCLRGKQIKVQSRGLKTRLRKCYAEANLIISQCSNGRSPCIAIGDAPSTNRCNLRFLPKTFDRRQHCIHLKLDPGCVLPVGEPTGRTLILRSSARPARSGSDVMHHMQNERDRNEERGQFLDQIHKYCPMVRWFKRPAS